MLRTLISIFRICLVPLFVTLSANASATVIAAVDISYLVSVSASDGLLVSRETFGSPPGLIGPDESFDRRYGPIEAIDSVADGVSDIFDPYDDGQEWRYGAVGGSGTLTFTIERMVAVYMDSNSGGWANTYGADYIRTENIGSGGISSNVETYSSGWLTATGMEEFFMTDFQTLVMTVDMSMGDSVEFHIDNTVYTEAFMGIAEPTTLTLMALGLAGLGFARRERQSDPS